MLVVRGRGGGKGARQVDEPTTNPVVHVSASLRRVVHCVDISALINAGSPRERFIQPLIDALRVEAVAARVTP